MSKDGSLPPGVTLKDINEQFGDDLAICEECGLPFQPFYEGDRFCAECRKEASDNE